MFPRFSKHTDSKPQVTQICPKPKTKPESKGLKYSISPQREVDRIMSKGEGSSSIFEERGC